MTEVNHRVTPEKQTGVSAMQECLYVLSMKAPSDCMPERGAFHYIQMRNGMRALPVFSTRERAKHYADTNLTTPTAYLQGLESLGPDMAPALAAQQTIISPCNPEAIEAVVSFLDADYLVRDPELGPRQKLLAVSERAIQAAGASE